MSARMLRLAPATLRRLVLLAVVSTLAIGVIAVRYLGVFGAAGIGVRDVTLELPDASGLHESSPGKLARHRGAPQACVDWKVRRPDPAWKTA